MKELVQLNQAMRYARIRPKSDDGKKFFILFLKASIGEKSAANLYRSLFKDAPKKKREVVKAFPIRYSSKAHTWLDKAKDTWNPLMKTMSYDIFLSTEYWQYIRNAKMEIADWKCEGCHSTNRLQVHHLDYSHRGEDHLHHEHLVVLCDFCHKRRHHIKS